MVQLYDTILLRLFLLTIEILLSKVHPRKLKMFLQKSLLYLVKYDSLICTVIIKASQCGNISGKFYRYIIYSLEVLNFKNP